MKFFPHTPIIFSTTAISASLGQSTSYLNNFASISIAVATASVALNITGSAGTIGTDYTKIGATGSAGSKGTRGARGDSVFLLSGSWNIGTCATAPCYEYTLVESNGSSECDYGTEYTYYSPTASLQNGTVMYLNDVCSNQAPENLLLGYGGYSVQISAAGVFSQIEVCYAV